MNRETKRAMARQRTADPARLQQLRKQQVAQRQQAAKSGVTQGAKRGSRLRGIGTFGGEVTAELRKVSWPDRRTVFGYAVVVLVSVSVITTIIFGLDTLFGKFAVWVFAR